MDGEWVVRPRCQILGRIFYTMDIERNFSEMRSKYSLKIIRIPLNHVSKIKKQLYQKLKYECSKKPILSSLGFKVSQGGLRIR